MRYHFALDLGVDRDDVVGALDAFTNGRERVVDLAEVNGRVFVNNVSLGVYAEAVQREGYRDAKLRTIAETMPTVLGSGGEAFDLALTWCRWLRARQATAALVETQPGRRSRIASGNTPRLDAGVLGIAVLGAGAGESACSSGLQQSSKSAPTPPSRRHRRRSAKARPAAALSYQATRSPSADRSATPGRLSIGDHAGKPVGRESAWSPASRRTVPPSDTSIAVARGVAVRHSCNEAIPEPSRVRTPFLTERHRSPGCASRSRAADKMPIRSKRKRRPSATTSAARIRQQRHFALTHNLSPKQCSPDATGYDGGPGRPSNWITANTSSNAPTPMSPRRAWRIRKWPLIRPETARLPGRMGIAREEAA